MGNAVFGGVSSIYPWEICVAFLLGRFLAVRFIGFHVEDFELPSEVFPRCKKKGCRSLFCRRMERLEKHRRGKGSRKALMKRGRQAARKRNAISVIEVHARARFPPDTVKPQAVRPRCTPSNRADAKYLPYMYSFKMQKAPSSSASPPYRPRRMRFFLRHGPSAGTGVFSFGLWFYSLKRLSAIFPCLTAIPAALHAFLSPARPVRRHRRFQFRFVVLFPAWYRNRQQEGKIPVRKQPIQNRPGSACLPDDRMALGAQPPR